MLLVCEFPTRMLLRSSPPDCARASSADFKFAYRAWKSASVSVAPLDGSGEYNNGRVSKPPLLLAPRARY